MDPVFAKDLLDRLARMERKQDITAVALVELKTSVSDLSNRMAPVEAHVAEVEFWTRLFTKSRVALVAAATLSLTLWDRFGDRIKGFLNG